MTLREFLFLIPWEFPNGLIIVYKWDTFTYYVVFWWMVYSFLLWVDKPKRPYKAKSLCSDLLNDHIREFNRYSYAAKSVVITDIDWNKDLGSVVGTAISDPGPCCCDWLHGRGWRVCRKPWLLVCWPHTQSVMGHVTVVFFFFQMVLCGPQWAKAGLNCCIRAQSRKLLCYSH